MDEMDFVSHHLHAVKWKGRTGTKRLHDALHISWLVHSILKSRSIRRIGRRPFRILWASGIVLLWAAVVFAFFANLVLFMALMTLLLALVGTVGLWYYVQEPYNWEYFISEPDKWKAFLLDSKREFEQTLGSYPLVVRHGWNLPPQGSGGFYLTEMGVLADASAVTTGGDSRPTLPGRTLVWQKSNPYYTSLSGDYNESWSGKEEDRGLLEVPVVLGNIAHYGFGDEEKRLIEGLPENALAGVYVHPWDDFGPVREWVLFLKANYKVTFVRADSYVKMLMRNDPRPVLLDKDLKPRWAVLKEGRLTAIREVDDAQAVSTRLVASDGGSFRITLTVNTASPLPLLGIGGSRATEISGKVKFEGTQDRLLAKRVAPGVYDLEINPGDCPCKDT